MIVSIVICICIVLLIYSGSKKKYFFSSPTLSYGLNNRPILLQPPVIILILLIILLLILRLTYNWIKPLSVDEIEHLHSAWLVSKGLVPYQDFFQHHPPLFWWILAVPLKLFNTITVFQYADVIKLGIGFLAISIYILLALISKEIYENWISAITTFSILILSGWGKMFDIIFEIRPDILMFFFFSLSLYIFIKFQKNPANKRYFYFGIFFAVFSQFVMPKLPISVCLLIGYNCYAMVKQHGFRSGLQHAAFSLIFSIGFSLIIHGIQISLIDMFNFVFRVNMGIGTYLENRFSLMLADRYILILFFSGAGFFLTLSHLKKDWLDPSKLLLLVLMGSFIELLTLYSHLIPQYYLSVYLLLSILGGGITLIHRFDYRFIDILLLIICLFLAFNFPPFSERHSVKKAQFESIQYLMDNSNPSDTVFLNPTLHPIFRFDASYYWFTHFRVLPYLSKNINKYDFLPFKEELMDVRVALNKNNPIFINTPESFCWSPEDMKHLNSMSPDTITEIPFSYTFYLSSLNPLWPLGVATYLPPENQKQPQRIK